MREPKDPRLAQALASINGSALEERINQLAGMSSEGAIGKGGSRLGLSSAENAARALLSHWMQKADMAVQEHPLGVIGRYKGSNNQLASVSFGSHFDTVPASGKYDGPAGTIAAISVAEAFREADIRFRRPLTVFAFTLEESSRFNAALLGSRAITHGLTPEQLSLPDSAGVSLAQAIESHGFDPESVRLPAFRRKPYAYIEMHIEQASVLADRGVDIGAVEAIAATDRQKILIGEGVIPKVGLKNHTQGLSFTVNGQAGHSGGTPMGADFRADGLVPAADFIEGAYHAHNHYADDVDLHILGVDIADQALNKIPGQTETSIIISGNNSDRVTDFRQSLIGILDSLNKDFSGNKYPKYKGNAITIHPDSGIDVPTEVFDPKKTLPLFRTASGIIMAVESIVESFGASRTVGTVGTFRQLPEGPLELGVDIRGVDGAARASALRTINNRIEYYAAEDEVVVKTAKLPSVGNASHMSPDLIALVEESALGLDLSVIRMPSGPGHDAQNFVERGIPTGMIFIPSRNEGLSHNPNEYSTPKDLENGAKVLASVVAALASR